MIIINYLTDQLYEYATRRVNKKAYTFYNKHV